MVADNLTVSSWAGCVCSAFRKLATVMPLACGFFVGSAYSQEVPYFNPVTGGYYKTAQEACEAAIPGLEADFAARDSLGRTMAYTYAGVASSGTCSYNYRRSGGGSGI